MFRKQCHQLKLSITHSSFLSLISFKSTTNKNDPFALEFGITVSHERELGKENEFLKHETYYEFFAGKDAFLSLTFGVNVNAYK